MAEKIRTCVTGAGGFIGSHLVNFLKEKGHWVKGIDIKKNEFLEVNADKFSLVDLRDKELVQREFMFEDIDWVFHLAADMGGVGYINENNNATIYKNNSLIDINVIDVASAMKVKKFFYSSSACVYPEFLQYKPEIEGLKEGDAIPAQPDTAYGWEKLMTEYLLWHYQKEFGMSYCVGRFHNIYGDHCTYNNGKEKFPAAICRKVLESKDGKIEIWGDGEQTRTFLHVNDCIRAVCAMMEYYTFPANVSTNVFNVGSEELISVNDFVDMVCSFEGKQLEKIHLLDKPQGVRGRRSNNEKIEKKLGWKQEISLRDGVLSTYNWIKSKILENENV